MKIAVLGSAGSIGSRHLANLMELGHETRAYDVYGVSSHTREAAIRWAEAVVIATPTYSHFEDIISCTKANKPMFVEKPLVGLYEEWHGCPLHKIVMVGYNLRFHSVVKKAKEMMGVGMIGKPLWARFTCAQFNDRPQYRRDGVILNWSHEIDLAIYLLGAATFEACAHSKNEDMADIALYHERTGCRSTIHLDYVTKPEHRGFVIMGEDGCIAADLVARSLIHKDLNNKVVGVYAGRDSWDGNYLDEMRKFIDRLNGKDVIGCTAAEAILVNHICFQAKGLVK